MAFHEVIGHRRLLSLLSQAIRRDSLIPSLIFSGPEGVGKQLTAIAIAQGFNCTALRHEVPGSVELVREPMTPGTASDGLTFDACGKCSACRRIARGTHPDVQVIEPGEMGSIKVEQVRAATDRAVFRPFEGRRRVTIVRHADAMVPAAQNALLKPLEEPLPASVFILVTSRPDSLLPTVLSRCSHLRFGRLQVTEVAQVLERSHGYSKNDARAAAAASDGSVQRALELDAGEFADARSDAEELLEAAGRDPRTRLERAKMLLKGEGSPSAEREHLSARLQALLSLLRDLGLVASGGDGRLLANLDRGDELKVLARKFGTSRIERSFAAVTIAQDALDRNVGAKVIADWLAINVD
jgi:DNA polymerase-3 subunit delta'